jgi:hypothetical protein
VALAPPGAAYAAKHRARILHMALENDEVRGGDPIVLDYKTSAASGTVRLIDQDGTVRAEALLNRHGNSILIAPYVEADQDFRVVLDVARGRTRAESSAALRILRTPLPASDFASAAGGEATSAANVPPPLDPAQAPMIAAAPPGTKTTGPIAVPTGDFIAGSTIPVSIVHPEKGLRISLVSPLGEEVQGVDVASGQSAVTKYMIVVTYTRGYEQETVIRPVTVRAR